MGPRERRGGGLLGVIVVPGGEMFGGDRRLAKHGAGIGDEVLPMALGDA